MNKIIRDKARSIYLNIMGNNVKPSKGIHLLNSHLLSTNDIFDSNLFDNKLKLLSKYSTIISFEEAVELIKLRKKVSSSLIAFSFDDGLEEGFTHIAPVIEKYNATTCFFINPNFINGNEAYTTHFLKDKVHLPNYKKAMTWEQIHELSKKKHLIGAHTMDHVNIGQINTVSDLHYQIGKCKNIIENQINDKCNFFAFPYGRIEHMNEKSVAIAQQYYKNIFSATNWKNYFSYNGQVINRRHIEPYWPLNHINYFLSKHIEY